MKNIEPRNADGKPHGYWETYNYDGTLNFKGHYKNGNAIGYCVRNWSTGFPSIKCTYGLDGNCIGYRECYNLKCVIESKTYYIK